MSLELLKQEFEHVLQNEDPNALHAFLDQQNITEIADLVYEEPEQAAQIVAAMSVHRASGVFRILEFPVQRKIIEELSPSKTAELLNELPPDDRTSFLEDLPSNVVRELIKQLNPEERKVTLSLLGYPENSVGRLMTPDYVYIYEDNTVAEVLDIIRRVGKNTETIDVIYVINEKGELLDDLRIREFILADPDSRVSELMDDRVIALNAYQDQEEANEAFKMNNRVALPVVSNSNKLLGIVTIDDILWVASEEFSEDIQKIGGTAALEQPYLEIPLMSLFSKRVVWLMILFVGELITITAMHRFEDEIAKVVVLATFIPLIISSGGNSGSQAATLIIQAMALSELSIRDWWFIMRREILSGLLLGGTLGIMGVTVIFVWNSFSDVFGIYYWSIACTIGLSLIGVVLWGTLVGSMLPLILKRLGADPAASSTPFVATLVDVTGLIIYFSVAYLFLMGKLL
ncbi:magnesium transporter [Flaviaesturariibacter amylovorans]|uniref:Magnesium transporter MgtE n=1 Tax=Flaviaesturariibacter amylovorans TaxID=1084520 RepID=A0ABP8H3P8_9BACT